MKRLCMVVHGPYPVGEPRVEQEAQCALGGGWEVDVVAMRRAGEPAHEVVEGVRVIRLPLAHGRGGGLLALGEYLAFTSLATVRVAVLHLRRRYAVVQVHAPPEFLVASALAPRLLGARVILDVHDRGSDMFSMRFGSSRLAGAVLQRLERVAAAASDAVLTVHDPYARALRANGIPAEKLTVVMNTPDERFLPDAGSPPLPGFRVVYHGTITPAYGLELLVEAAALARETIPELELEIVGEGDGDAAVTRRASELGLADRLTLTGRYLPRREAISRVAGAAAGVIPNPPIPLNDFALPSKLFEYVALGIPAAAPELPTLREYFSDEELFFYRAGDAESLADALRTIAAAPEAAAAHAAAARRRFEQYRWTHSADRYLSVLERLGTR